MKRDPIWWLGQLTALFLTITLLFDGYSFSASAMAGYALAVLVDIRSLLMAKAD